MKQLGDITRIRGDEIEPVDCITGGSPCQDLSIANGARKGLAGERSGLFMHQIRIIKEMRQHEKDIGRTGSAIRPRYLVWENVMGAYSSNSGRDLASVLEEVIRIAEPKAPAVPVPDGGWPRAGCLYDEMGRWSVAFRLHDAQFWGVPQRRTRIALVADFAGLSAPEVLFERKGLCWDSEQSETAGQGAPARAGGGADPAICILGNVADRNADCNGKGWTEGVSFTLNTVDRHVVCLNDRGGDGMDRSKDDTATLRTQPHDREPILLESNQNHATIRTDGVSTALPASAGMGGGYVPMICAGFKHKAGSSAGSVGYGNELAPTLSAEQTSAVYDARARAGEPSIMVFSQNQRDEVRDLKNVAGALASEPGVKQQTYVCENRGNSDRYTCPAREGQPASEYSGADRIDAPVVLTEHGLKETRIEVTLANGQTVTGTLMAAEESKLWLGNQEAFSGSYYPLQNSAVRRLTPSECEKLQGYPTGWTEIGEPVGCETWTDEDGQEHTNTIYAYTDSKGRKRKTSDAARYKALGNSIALPFWFWLLRRISAQYERPATLGSLFDGIGGFPLCWERCNGKGTARWASEIEEFPMAVTRYHFPDEPSDQQAR